jgi:hypothetical protein
MHDFARSYFTRVLGPVQASRSTAVAQLQGNPRLLA